MSRRWTLMTGPIAMTLLVATAGCSDQPADKDVAVVIPDPSTSTKSPTKSEPAPKVTPAESADTKAE